MEILAVGRVILAENIVKAQIATPFLGITNTVPDSYKLVSLNQFTHLSQLGQHYTYILISHK